MAPVPFADFAVPSVEYLLVLGVGTVTVLALLWTLEPPITQETLLAAVPWTVVGSALHVFYQLGESYQVRLYPPIFEPLFAAPAVYLTAFVVAGTVWILAAFLGTATGDTDGTNLYWGLAGTGVAVVLLGLLGWQSLDPAIEGVRLVIPTVTTIGTVALAAGVYLLFGLWRPYVIADVRTAGWLVLFAHMLDGVSTAVGTDLLGVGERSVIPARIMEFAGQLPTAEYIGVGWLFVLVKIVVALAVIWLFAPYVREEPRRGYLALAIVMLVGLGPAVNNLLLFFLGVP